MCMCAITPVWTPKDDVVEPVISFHLYMGSEDCARGSRLVQQAPSPTEPTRKPQNLFS